MTKLRVVTALCVLFFVTTVYFAYAWIDTAITLSYSSEQRTRIERDRARLASMFPKGATKSEIILSAKHFDKEEIVVEKAHTVGVGELCFHFDEENQLKTVEIADCYGK